MDSNPIFHLFPRIKWNAHFCITFNLWWSARLVNGLEPYLPSLSKQKNDMFIFVLHSSSDHWLGWSMDSNPYLQPLSSQNNEMLIFGLCSASDSWLGWSIYSNPIHHLSPAKKWNAHFCITFNFWWLARLVNGLKPHLQPVSNQKNQMLIFVLCSNSGDQLSWSIDSNPICHPSPTKKWNACFCITLYFW